VIVGRLLALSQTNSTIEFPLKSAELNNVPARYAGAASSQSQKAMLVF
jgi:hypothetical protein